MPNFFGKVLRKREKGSHEPEPPQDMPRGSRALGLRVVHEPTSPEDISVDIVFVHGLRGDGMKTWTERSSGVFWPGDLLAQDLPSARISTFAYDAHLSTFWHAAGSNTLNEHANNLLLELANMREASDTDTTPIIWVAHSMGGILVQDALLLSKNSSHAYRRQIIQTSRGILFFGTPHSGANTADWGRLYASFAKMLGSNANPDIARTVEPRSDVLARIQREFRSMSRSRETGDLPPLEIMCVFETHHQPLLRKPIVPKESAILPEYDYFSIDATHTDLVRFSSRYDQGYGQTLGVLGRWYRTYGRPGPSAAGIRPSSAFDMPSAIELPAESASQASELSSPQSPRMNVRRQGNMQRRQHIEDDDSLYRDPHVAHQAYTYADNESESSVDTRDDQLFETSSAHSWSGIGNRQTRSTPEPAYRESSRRNAAAGQHSRSNQSTQQQHRQDCHQRERRREYRPWQADSPLPTPASSAFPQPVSVSFTGPHIVRGNSYQIESIHGIQDLRLG